MRFFLTAILFLPYFITACATRPSLAPQDHSLFPLGVYEQNLEVEIIKGEKSKSYNATVILKKEKNQSSLVAMTGFGITLFKAKYFDGKIDVESFLPEETQERIKIFAAAILDFHNAPSQVEKNNYLTRWTTLSIQEIDAQKRPVKGQLKSTYFTVDFTIEGFDARGIPKSFRLTHEKMRSVTTIEKYQLLNASNLKSDQNL